MTVLYIKTFAIKILYIQSLTPDAEQLKWIEKFIMARIKYIVNTVV